MYDMEAGANYAAEYALVHALRRTIGRARKTTRFYRDYPMPLDMEAFTRLPLLDNTIFIDNSTELIGAAQENISRVVSNVSSGTTGIRKRVFFTEEDLERTILYFCRGMRKLIEPGQTAAVCFPQGNPNGLTDLLSRGMQRFGAGVCVLGVPQGGLWTDIAHMLQQSGAICAIGAPVPMLGLLEYCLQNGIRHTLKTVLLSADYAAESLKKRINQMGIEVFTHYGMTEFGYGGALECGFHNGMHIREEDLYFEAVTPDGMPSKTGVGEIVVTTLNQEGMPLIRYRTGDTGRITRGLCACQEPGARLFIQGRDSKVAEIDAMAFGIEGVIDWRMSAANELTLHLLRTEEKYIPRTLLGYAIRTSLQPTVAKAEKRTFNALTIREN